MYAGLQIVMAIYCTDLSLNRKHPAQMTFAGLAPGLIPLQTMATSHELVWTRS